MANDIEKPTNPVEQQQLGKVLQFVSPNEDSAQLDALQTHRAKKQQEEENERIRHDIEFRESRGLPPKGFWTKKQEREHLDRHRAAFEQVTLEFQIEYQRRVASGELPPLPPKPPMSERQALVQRLLHEEIAKAAANNKGDTDNV